MQPAEEDGAETRPAATVRSDYYYRHLRQQSSADILSASSRSSASNPVTGQSGGRLGHEEPLTWDPEGSEHRNVAYELVVRQHPFHARCCGAGDKDRRVIDPPPVVELIAKKDNVTVDPSKLAAMVFVVYVSLWSADGSEWVKSSPKIPGELSLMVGDMVVPPSVAYDETNRLCCFFVFPDISVRVEGHYRLKFALANLADFSFQLISQDTSSLASAISDPFKVYSAKSFPGMLPASSLSRKLMNQGLRMPIRKYRMANVDKRKRVYPKGFIFRLRDCCVTAATAINRSCSRQCYLFSKNPLLNVVSATTTTSITITAT
ncbi:velvet factor-domain-containing protein [Chytridium lagenaria]|nr:velvet factor-domain-containing protein [Chytridium lagenaria]